MSTKITELTKGLTTEARAEIADLHSRMKKIYALVNMDVRRSLVVFAFGLKMSIVLYLHAQYEPGSRKILDVILLSLAEIALTQQKDVAIYLDEDRPRWCRDGASPRFGIWIVVGGSVDYEYEDGQEGWVKSSNTVAPGMTFRSSQTACSPLVDSKTTHLRLRRVTCS